MLLTDVCSYVQRLKARTFKMRTLVFATCFCPIKLHVNARIKNETKALAHATRLLSRWTKLLIHGTKALTGLYGFIPISMKCYAKIQKIIEFVKFFGMFYKCFGNINENVLLCK